MLAARRMMNNRHRGSSLLPAWLSTAGVQQVNSFSTSISGGTFTPPANTLLLAAATWLTVTGVGSTTTGISDTIGGLTWHEITSGWHSQIRFGNTTGAKTSVFWAVTGSSPPSGHVTLTSGVNTSKHLEVVKIPAANTSSPVGVSGFGDNDGINGASARNLTATTTGSPASDGLMIGVLGSTITSDPPGSVTEDANFTRLFDAVGTGHFTFSAIDCAYNLNGVGSVTWALGATSSEFWFDDGILVEINE